MQSTTTALMHIVESILFVHGEPVEVSELARALEVDVPAAEEAVAALRDACDIDRRGVRIVRYGDKVQMATRAEYLPWVQRIMQPPRVQQLSQAALETLSIIAYRQPVTRGDIEAVRGVKCDYSIQMLLGKGLIEERGKKEVVGHPTLFGTTELFLKHFGIRSLEELPTVEVKEEQGEVLLQPPGTGGQIGMEL